MQVLFVTPYLPSPPRFGGQRRLDGLMRHVAAKHEVSVVSLVDPGEDHAASVAATRGYCRRVVTVPAWRRYAGGSRKRALQLGSLVTPWSYERVVYRAPELQRALAEMVRGECFDVVQFEFAQMAVHTLPGGARRPVAVLDEHNIEYDVVRRTAGADVGPVRRLYSALDWRKLRREERAAWKRFDGCVLTSARDRDVLWEEAAGVTSCVVPNGVDVDEFAPDPMRAIDPDRVLFFGAIDYHPNTDGVLHFLREVWPLLRARKPSLRFHVVGPKPPPAITGWPDLSVRVHGYVPDIRAAVGDAAVVVVPLRIGGGTRLKVVEAMAMGKAIVSTRVGAEGIDVVHERHALLADGPADFAAQVLRVLEDPGLARRLGAEARRLAVERYSWRAGADRLMEFHRELGASG